MNIQTLLSDWNFTRIVRLILGVIFGLHAINEFDSISAILSIFLLFQAITNTGCMGMSCAVPANNNGRDKLKEIELEEIKQDK